MTVIFTNGCFDVIHIGHVKILEECSKLGDVVIVGLNSDNSVKKIKGVNRPINTQEDRRKILESIRFVDKVVIFDEETPLELIKEIKPDIIVKGGDYKEEDVVGRNFILEYGGRVIIVELLPDRSTSKILEKNKDDCLSNSCRLKTHKVNDNYCPNCKNRYNL